MEIVVDVLIVLFGGGVGVLVVVEVDVVKETLNVLLGTTDEGESLITELVFVTSDLRGRLIAVLLPKGTFVRNVCLRPGLSVAALVTNPLDGFTVVVDDDETAIASFVCDLNGVCLIVGLRVGRTTYLDAAVGCGL